MTRSRVEQSCPLCGLSASCIEVAGEGGNLIDVECARCTRYVISRWASAASPSNTR